MQCPNCGAENQSGKFCGACGAALDATCASCGAEVPAGANYCVACGEPVAGGGGATGVEKYAPWIIAAVSVVVVVALVLIFVPGDTRTAGPAPGGSPAAPAMGSGSPTGGAGLSADMRTNADRLFNRIMMAAEQGNQAEVDQFMPMAIQAYDMVEDLDDDGLYHLALLHLTVGSEEQALATARRILDGDPQHLLALAVAAEAAEGLGDAEQAAAYWQRYLDAYETQVARPLPEYVDHEPMLAEYRSMAQEAVGQE